MNCWRNKLFMKLSAVFIVLLFLSICLFFVNLSESPNNKIVNSNNKIYDNEEKKEKENKKKLLSKTIEKNFISESIKRSKPLKNNSLAKKNSNEKLEKKKLMKDIIKVAKLGLPFFLGKVPEGQEKLYGFSPNDSLNDIELGKPLQLYVITPDSLFKYKPTTDSLNSLLSETNIWLFPLEIDGVYKSMLIVDKMNGEWQTVSLGRTQLAKSLDIIRGEYLKDESKEIRLIAVRQVKKYYFHIPNKDENNFTQIVFNNKYSTLTNINDLIEPLIMNVKNNIKK